MAKHKQYTVSRFKRRWFNKRDLMLALLILINLGTFLTVSYPYYYPYLVKYGIIKG